MAKLVIGTNKQTIVPAVVRDMSPEIYRVFRVNNGKIENSITTHFLPLPSTATDISDFCYANAYKSTPASVLSGTIDLSSLTKISGSSAFYHMFNGCKGITSVDLSSVTTMTGSQACYYMFMNCSGLTSANLSSLTTLSAQHCCSSMFAYCSGLSNVNLSNLTTISSNCCYSTFQGCTSLTSIDLSSLTTISGPQACLGMFDGCRSLTSVNLSSLTTLTGIQACSGMFKYCTSLTSLSFPALTSNSFGSSYKNQFDVLIQGVTGCTLHFPSNLDPQSGSTVISSLTGYPNFGGTNTVLAFDLPATE